MPINSTLLTRLKGQWSLRPVTIRLLQLGRLSCYQLTLLRQMAGVEGLEPPTYRLTVYRSTNWTIHPSTRFIRLSSDRVYILYHTSPGLGTYTIDFRKTTFSQQVLQRPSPHTVFSLTPNLQNAMRVAGSPILVVFCLSEKTKAKQTHQQGISYLPQITCRADNFHPFAYKNLILCHDTSASTRRETNPTL